jgi:Zn-dependent peptidase ImmA (M78 family)
MDNQTNYTELGLKLKQAREATGMSTRVAVTLLPKNLMVSHVTLTNYESGKHQAPLDILAALADLYQRPINWFLEKSPTLTGIHYRNKKSKIGVHELTQFEAVAQQWLDAYRRLDEEFNSVRRKERFEIAADGTGADAAAAVRKHLGLDKNEPITSVIEVMETAGIRVMEISTKLNIDAIAARFGEEDIVILNTNVPNDRSRMNAAHELGHVLFRDYADSTPSNYKLLENRAFEFASYFLLTKHMLRSAFLGRSMVRLVQFKERFGISLAAMIYRAEVEGILSNQRAKQLWIEFSKRGWRREEPGHVKKDRATRFEQILESAISKNKLTWQQAAKLTGIREDQLRERVNLAIDMCEPIRFPEKGEDDNIQYLRIVN